MVTELSPTQARAQRAKVLTRGKKKINRLVTIAQHGRSGNGQLIPRLTANGTPICDGCGQLYLKARLAQATFCPHLCCSCASIVEREAQLCGRANHHLQHLVHGVPRYEDMVSGKGTRY